MKDWGEDGAKSTMKILKLIRLLEATSNPNQNYQKPPKQMSLVCFQRSPCSVGYSSGRVVRSCWLPEFATWSEQQMHWTWSWSLTQKVTIPTTGDRLGQSLPLFLTRHRGKWCCGQWLPSVDFLAENFATNSPVSNELLQLGFLFFICVPRVSQHNYSGRPSQNGHGLQFSFSNNSAENRGEGGREKKTQTSEKAENTSKLCFKNEKIKITNISVGLCSRWGCMYVHERTHHLWEVVPLYMHVPFTNKAPCRPHLLLPFHELTALFVCFLLGSAS